MCRTLGFQDGFVAAGGEEVSEVQASAVWSECQRNSALPLIPSLLQSCLFIHAFSLFLWGPLTLVLDPMAQGCLSVLCFFHTGELQGELLSNNIIIKKQKKKVKPGLTLQFYWMRDMEKKQLSHSQLDLDLNNIPFMFSRYSSPVSTFLFLLAPWEKGNFTCQQAQNQFLSARKSSHTRLQCPENFSLSHSRH